MNWMGSEVTDRTNFRMVESWHEWEARLPTRQDNLLNGEELTWMGSEVTDRTTFWMVESWHEWEARLPTGHPSEWWRVDMNEKRGYRQDTLLNGGELTWMRSEITGKTTFWMVESWHEWEARLQTWQPSVWWRVDMNGKRGYRQDNLLCGGELTWTGSEVNDRTTFQMGKSWHELNGKRGYRQDKLPNGGELTRMGSEVTDSTTFWMVESWHEWEARLPTGQLSEWWRVDMNWMESDVTDSTTFWMVESWNEWEARSPTGHPSEWWRVDKNGKRGSRRTTFWMEESWHEWEARLPTGQPSGWWRVDMNGKPGYREDNLLNGWELSWTGSEVIDRTTFCMVESWHEWEARSPTGHPSEWWRGDTNGKRSYRQDNLMNGGESTWMGS